MYTNTRTTATRLRNRDLYKCTQLTITAARLRKIQLTTTAARLRKIDPTTAKMSASPACRHLHVAAVVTIQWYYVLHYTNCNGIVYYTTRSSYHQRLQVVTFLLSKSSMAGKHIPSSMCLRTLHLYLVNILA